MKAEDFFHACMQLLHVFGKVYHRHERQVVGEGGNLLKVCVPVRHKAAAAQSCAANFSADGGNSSSMAVLRAHVQC